MSLPTSVYTLFKTSCRLSFLKAVVGTGAIQSTCHMMFSPVEPPGPVLSLQAITTNDSVTVTWEKPSVLGRDDFYYTIQYSDPDKTGTFLPAKPIKINSTESNVSYNITGLRPFTPYTIKVITHNGVSDQDTENAAKRKQDLLIKTKEGGK